MACKVYKKKTKININDIKSKQIKKLKLKQISNLI